MAIYSREPFGELTKFQGSNCAVVNHYHGHIPQTVYNFRPKFLIYSCFGEVLSSQQFLELTDNFPDSFVILVTARKYQDIPHSSDRYIILQIPSAYAWYSEQIPRFSYQIESRSFKKRFLSLNNRSAWPRQALAQNLVQSGLLQHFYFSYHCHDRDGIGSRKIYDIVNNQIGRCWFNDTIDFDSFFELLPMALDSFAGNDWSFGQREFYTNSFASVVNETYIDENEDPFFTEKAFKPLAYGHPFLLFSSAGALKLLRDLGFETFPDVFDESYDTLQSPQIRFEHILKQIHSLCALPDDVIMDIFYSNRSRLQHNIETFYHDLPELYRKDIKLLTQKIKHIL